MEELQPDETPDDADSVEIVPSPNGLVVVGPDRAVEAYVKSQNLPSRAINKAQLWRALGSAGAVTQAAATISASSGRWVEITAESAEHMRQLQAMRGSTDGVVRAILMKDGKTEHIVEIVKNSPLKNPTTIASVGTMATQLAMQQTMDQIIDYLQSIESKVDDVLRGQKDQVYSRLISVGAVIDEAMAVRESTGRVGEVTWSKVQTAPAVIAEVRGYALLQLDGIARKLDEASAVSDAGKLAKESRRVVDDWLAVLARCTHLEDAHTILELDRVMDLEPDQLVAHRQGLEWARAQRRNAIERSTETLLTEMAEAADRANAKVLLHPLASGPLVVNANAISRAVERFQVGLGFGTLSDDIARRRWLDAAGDVRDRAVGSGAASLDAARAAGAGAARGIRDKARGLSAGLSARTVRRKSSADDSVGDGAEDGVAAPPPPPSSWPTSS